MKIHGGDLPVFQVLQFAPAGSLSLPVEGYFSPQRRSANLRRGTTRSLALSTGQRTRIKRGRRFRAFPPDMTPGCDQYDMAHPAMALLHSDCTG